MTLLAPELTAEPVELPAPVDDTPTVVVDQHGPIRPLRHVRPLDGLRGIAVAVVVAYHLAPGLVPGGFLGVSLFFTLSGFLITNLLVNEWETSGSIGLRSFWSRRFRRLLPASLVALVVAVAVAAVAADAAALHNLPGDVMAALAYVANWRFILNGDVYGSGYQQPSVVLHFWSLAIEEQFYVVVALTTGLLARLTTRRRWWFIVFGAFAAGSMVCTLAWYAPGDSSRVYFGSLTRAFELLAGALLALAVTQQVPRRLQAWRGRHVAGIVVAVVFALLVATTHSTDDWLYRGGLWFVALGSCGLVLAALDSGWLARGLSWRPLVALGLVSYGVYLYHWPLFLLLTPERVHLDGVPLAAVRVVATLALAIPSYILIEQPIRRGRIRLRPPIVIPAVASVAVLVVASSLALRADATRRSVAQDTPDVALSLPVATAAPDTMPVAQVSQPLQRVLFLGDSLVHQPFPTIQDRLASAGIGSRAIGGPGESLMTDQGRWLDDLSTAIDEYDPDVVVLEGCCGSGNPWKPEAYVGPDGTVLVPDSDAQFAEWTRLATEATRLAQAHGRRVMWILAPPAHTNGYYGPIEGRIGRVNDIYAHIAACGASVGLIDWRVIAAPDGSFTPTLPDTNGNPVTVRMPDGLHFTPAGQALLADFTRTTLQSYWTQVGGRADASGPAPATSCPA